MNKYLPLRGIIASLSLFLILAVAGPQKAFAQPNNPPVITGANGFPNLGGVINGLETCQNTPLYICVTATDPDGDGINLSSVVVTTGSGATITDAVPGDLCFTYNPLSSFSGADQLEVIVCDDAAISLCDTVLINITVTPSVIADAGPDQLVCGPDVTTMAAVDPFPATGVWTQVAGLLAVIGDPTAYNTPITGLQYGISTFRWVVTNGSCIDSSDMNITYNAPIIVDAGSDDTICETAGSYTIPGASVASDTATLWTSSGTGVFDDPTILNPTYTPSLTDIINGSVVLTLTAYSDACPNDSDDLTLNISRQPIADAGPDDEMCETDISYTLSGATITNAVSVLWTTDGTGTFDDQTLDNPVYTPSLSDIQDGQILLSVTVYGDGICPDSSDAMILTVWPEAQVYAGEDESICEGSTFQPLNATALNYTGLDWTTAGDGTFNDASLLNPVYTPGAGDITAGSVVLTLTAFANGTCPDVTDDLTLFISDQPTAFAGVDAEICETGLYTLADATATNYTALMWTSTGTGTFTDPTVLNPTYTPSQDDIDGGFVVLTLTAYGDGICPDASDDMVLTITGQAVAYAGADAAICETAGSYTLADATAEEYASLEWSTGGDGTFDNTGILNPTYTFGPNDITSGSVVLTLTAYANGTCVDAVDDMLLSISLQPIADAGPDDEICETDGSYTLAGASTTNATSVLWTTDGTGTFDDTSIDNPVYTPKPV